MLVFPVLRCKCKLRVHLALAGNVDDMLCHQEPLKDMTC